MHLIFFPITYITAAIGPCVFTITIKLIIFPFTLVKWLIIPFINTIAMFCTIFKFTIINRAIFQSLFTLPMRYIFKPKPFINLSFYLDIFSFAVCFICYKLPFINVLVCMNNFPFSLHLIFVPKSIIITAIWPSLLTFTMFSPNLTSIFNIKNKFHLATVLGTFLFIYIFLLDQLVNWTARCSILMVQLYIRIRILLFVSLTWRIILMIKPILLCNYSWTVMLIFT